MKKAPVLNGARLKAARKAAGLRQQQLAALLGTTQAHVSALERESRAPSIELLKGLATTLGVSVHWLCGEQDPTLTDPSPMTPDHILSDAEAPPGLLALAADTALVASLGVTPAEWGCLRALQPTGPLSKQGYLMVLLAIRANIDKLVSGVSAGPETGSETT